jgi:uncharacterized membrane protein YphA (DoxX/SURF4 family)
MKFRNCLLLATRLFLGILFVYASIDKMRYPGPFSDTVVNYHLLPEALVNLFSLWLPVAEFLAGALLLLGVWSQAASGLILAMMAMFLIAIVQGVARGIDTHCGCFTQGGKGDPISVWTILRDVSFLAVAALGFWLERPIMTWRLILK